MKLRIWNYSRETIQFERLWSIRIYRCPNPNVLVSYFYLILHVWETYASIVIAIIIIATKSFLTIPNCWNNRIVDINPVESDDHVHEIELVHRTRHITRRSGRLSTTWQRGWRLTSTSLPRPHYELLCCAGDYGGAAGSIEDLGSPGVSPLPAYYEQSPIALSGTVQKGRPRKRKLSEVTGSELPVTMRLAAGESSQCMFRDLVRSWTIFFAPFSCLLSENSDF